MHAKYVRFRQHLSRADFEPADKVVSQPVRARKLFANLCKLQDDDIVNSLNSELASKEPLSAQSWPTDKEFQEAFRMLPIYGISPERCSFVLGALEDAFGHPEKIELEGLWIEHVMPQTLDERWIEYLGGDWERVHSKWADTIGNLTLIAPSPDQSLQNKLFSEKKKEWYGQSNVSLTKEINRKWEKWTEAEIIERADVLAGRAIEIWPRPE